MRTIRPRRQPIARKMPISLVRSNTETIIVLSIPMAPITSAIADMLQAMALAIWILLSVAT